VHRAASSLLPSPLVNHPIAVDGHQVVADLPWPGARLIVEVDSVQHHIESAYIACLARQAS